MPKNIEEDTSRTEVEPAVIAQASRDDVPDEETDAGTSGEATEKAASDGDQEVVETVELEEPANEEERDYEDQVADSDDPRLIIAKKHDEEHRKFDENDNTNESVESAGELDTIPDNDEPQFIEVKVFEETRSIEKSKIDAMPGATHEERVQAYQMRLAVDEGFKQNARQREQLDQREREIADREARLATQEQGGVPATDRQQAQQPPTDLPASDDLSMQELVAKYHEAFLDGDDDERDRLLLEINAKNRTAAQPIDVNAMTDEIATRAADIIVARDRKRKVIAATDKLVASHEELQVGHPKFDQRLFTAIDDETTIVEREHPDWEPEQVTQEAWSRIEKWRGSPQPDSMTSKQEQKRGLTRPQAGTGRRTPPPPPPVRTDSDYVRDLRRSRGLE